MENMTVLLVSEDPVLRGMIINALEATKHLQLEEVVTEASLLEDAAWKLTPDLIVATLGEDPESILEALASLGERCPEAILCGPAERSDLIIRSMQIGVREYVPLPIEPDASPKIWVLSDSLRTLARSPPRSMQAVSAVSQVSLVLSNTCTHRTPSSIELQPSGQDGTSTGTWQA